VSTGADPEVELVHVHGGELGLRRERRGDRFVILDPDGAPVDDPATLARVDALAIPPAWREVWIAMRPDAHLQATGLDAKGRRQYRYHPAWRVRRDREKFDDMLDFAGALPTLRRRVTEHLGDEAPRREHTLALALRLIDVGLFRVGWDRYARDNGHVGLATLRRDQVRLLDAAVRFDFIAKSGKRRRMTVLDPPTVRALAPLRRRRGDPAELLVYRAPAGWRRITAPDVNNALRCWGEGPYSAKEFRTWAATVLAATVLAREHMAGHHGPRAVSRAVRHVSAALGNTPAVARASYIDPRVIEAFDAGTVVELPDDTPEPAVPLRIDEREDGVVIELPTSATGDVIREEIERRALALLRDIADGR
jgi:DNA topoisomerase IB